MVDIVHKGSEACSRRKHEMFIDSTEFHLLRKGEL